MSFSDHRALKALVASSVLPLAQIGYALGFASQAHFTTTFHKLVGVTPGPTGVGIPALAMNLSRVSVNLL